MPEFTMMIIRRTIIFLSLWLLPPLAVYLTTWSYRETLFNLVLYITSQIVFWFLFAGPGLIVLGLSVLHGLFVVFRENIDLGADTGV